ncbi:hypothetical protein M422DRAFT_252918 [Sphaerobolus stellatus SS14]|uniref:Uncharacterized protein n=1 Tax=Sphaerobolus stellatus (strain SS14) TaxID=990650 RepID=A0A0C9UKR4_SPHS4|nr:hypothetical protein M422DRAFT_252918 [Sphaerobolus stellatus SS14]
MEVTALQAPTLCHSGSSNSHYTKKRLTDAPCHWRAVQREAYVSDTRDAPTTPVADVIAAEHDSDAQSMARRPPHLRTHLATLHLRESVGAVDVQNCVVKVIPEEGLLDDEFFAKRQLAGTSPRRSAINRTPPYPHEVHPSLIDTPHLQTHNSHGRLVSRPRRSLPPYPHVAHESFVESMERHVRPDSHPLAERNHRPPLPSVHNADDIPTDNKPSIHTNVNEPSQPRCRTSARRLRRRLQCYSHFIAFGSHFSTSTSNLRRSQSHGKGPSTTSTTTTTVSSRPSFGSSTYTSAGASGATSSTTHAPTPAPTFAPGISFGPPPPLPSRKGSANVLQGAAGGSPSSLVGAERDGPEGMSVSTSTAMDAATLPTSPATLPISSTSTSSLASMQATTTTHAVAAASSTSTATASAHDDDASPTSITITSIYKTLIRRYSRSSSSNSYFLVINFNTHNICNATFNTNTRFIDTLTLRHRIFGPPLPSQAVVPPSQLAPPGHRCSLFRSLRALRSALHPQSPQVPPHLLRRIFDINRLDCFTGNCVAAACFAFFFDVLYVGAGI